MINIKAEAEAMGNEEERVRLITSLLRWEVYSAPCIAVLSLDS